MSSHVLECGLGGDERKLKAYGPAEHYDPASGLVWWQATGCV